MHSLIISLDAGEVSTHSAPWKGCRNLCCGLSLVDSVGSAVSYLGRYCYLVGGVWVSRPGQCSGWSYGGGPLRQLLRKFARRLPRVILAETTPHNATGPLSMTGSSSIPTVAWSGCPCHWGYRTQSFLWYICCAPSPTYGRGRHWDLQQGLGLRRSGSGWVS